MSKDDKRPRDAFAFSLAGVRTISLFTAATAIADDRLRPSGESEVVDIPEIQSAVPEDQPAVPAGPISLRGRFWLSRRRRAA